jgi:hypothetical protein
LEIKKKVFFISILFPLISFIFAAIPNKCGTPQALEDFRRGVKLVRPTMQKSISSTHFVIHYDTSGTHVSSNAYAESVKKYAEYSYSKQIDSLGWIAPPPDGSGGGNSLYDIYVRNLSSGALGVTYAESPYTSPYLDGYTSYIYLDKDIASSYSWGVLQVTVAHEFSHSSQMRYSVTDQTWWMENTSTWMEDVCYNNVNDYVGYLSTTPNPLDSTHLAITCSDNLYWYAGAIWAMFLSEYYDINCPRRAWERIGSVSGDNTLSGVDYALSTYYTSNLNTALKKYAIWRYFTGSRADVNNYFSESYLWPTSYVLRTHTTYPASGTQSPYPVSGPGGTNFIRFTSGTGALNYIFDGQDGYTWGAFAIGYRVPSPSVEQEISLNSSGYGATNISWSGNSHIVLIPVVTQWASSPNNLTYSYQANPAIVKDVGVTAIENPTGTIDSTGPVFPRARVKNFGSDSVTFQTTFKIGGVYTNSRLKKLNSGQEDTVNFSSWSTPRGTWAARCSTYLVGDAVSGNDTLSNLVTVKVKDVGVTQITAPSDTIYQGSLAPKAPVRNYGTDPADFYTFFKIFDTLQIQVYLDSILVSALNSNSSRTLTFSEFNFEVGRYFLRCSTALTLDAKPTNNIKADSVLVKHLPPWVLKDSVPIGPNNRAVKSGSALVTGQANKIYSFKGNNTKEFFVYNVSGDSWSILESIPYNPFAKKKVYKGGSLAYNKNSIPDMIYATKGNNTLEFWVYDVDLDTWIGKTSVPFSTIPAKKVKGGACLAYLKRGTPQYIYLLKGGTLEFYAYHCQADTWIKSLTSAPAGHDLKSFRDGSCITADDGNDILYVLKGGAKYNEFYRYDAALNTWTELETIPKYSRLTNKKTKIKDGASLCYDSDSLVYAFKGGNRQEFWMYNINQNRWRELDTLPKGTGGRKISGGGALAFQDGKIYALKGNRTLEFWCYDPAMSEIPLSNDKSQISNVSEVSLPIIQVKNSKSDKSVTIVITKLRDPLISLNVLRKNISDMRRDSEATFQLYTSAGRLIQTLQTNNGKLRMTNNKLTSGVYYLKYSIGDNSETIKLIVE